MRLLQHPKKAKRAGKTASDLDWFYGLKDSLLLRDSKDGTTVDPDFTPGWAEWAGVDRTEVQDAAKGKDAVAAKETFDPVIVGGCPNRSPAPAAAADLARQQAYSYSRLSLLPPPPCL
jgi:hypothetical protein